MALQEIADGMMRLACLGDADDVKALNELAKHIRDEWDEDNCQELAGAVDLVAAAVQARLDRYDRLMHAARTAPPATAGWDVAPG
jgi:hypothetical protein